MYSVLSALSIIAETFSSKDTARTAHSEVSLLLSRGTGNRKGNGTMEGELCTFCLQSGIIERTPWFWRIIRLFQTPSCLSLVVLGQPPADDHLDKVADSFSINAD